MKIAAGKASHSAGLADGLSQAVALTPGEAYRGQVVLSGRSAGDLTPELTGGSDQVGAAAAADGPHLFTITAAAGNDHLAFAANSDFDGAIDDVVLYLVTPACAPQGAFDYYLEPQNSGGGAGPVTAAFTAEII